MLLKNLVRALVVVFTALAALAYYFLGGDYSAGRLWFEWDSASLPVAQAIIQRYLGAFGEVLWDPVVNMILAQPVWLILLVSAALLYAALRLAGMLRRR